MALFAVGILAGCSREQQDWRAAEGAGTSEAYGRFIEQHPQSELATHARARLTQLLEEHAWQQATQSGTIEGYREFLAQHPSGRLAEEARIRIEGFSLGSTPRIAAAVPANALQGVNGVRALQLADAGGTPVKGSGSAATDGTGRSAPADQSTPGRAVPGEEARPASDSPGQNSVSPMRSVVPATAIAGYAVQLGAFGNAASADREWQRLQGRFGDQFARVTPHIVAGQGPSGPLYRLQAPAPDEAQARATCAALRAQSQSCVPVLPQGSK